MMREYLFRGKRIDNDNWVEGGYIFDSGYPRILTHVKMHNEPIQQCAGYAVKPETVGQFTGLLDKNGQRTFGGDVVQMYRHSDDTHKHEKDFVSEVMFSMGAFYVVHHKYGSMEQTFKHMARPGQSFEVIGNIYDNPELLGGG